MLGGAREELMVAPLGIGKPVEFVIGVSGSGKGLAVSRGRGLTY